MICLDLLASVCTIAHRTSPPASIERVPHVSQKHGSGEWLLEERAITIGPCLVRG